MQRPFTQIKVMMLYCLVLATWHKSIHCEKLALINYLDQMDSHAAEFSNSEQISYSYVSLCL